MRKSAWINLSKALAVIVGAGLCVLIWWLVTRDNGGSQPETTLPPVPDTTPPATTVTDPDPESDISVIELDDFGDIENTAAFTSISTAGDMFWWFYPSTSVLRSERPIIMWLDGVTGIPPSLLANFGMFGPYDFNLNKREDSWVDAYNLLFVDAPLGTGFSTAINDNAIPNDIDGNTEHLLHVLETFYNRNSMYTSSPLYIFGEGHGAQIALSLATKLTEVATFEHNLKGVVLGNGIIAPALCLTKLGFYLEELGYIDGKGRDAIEDFSTQTNTLVNNGQLNDAFDLFLSLGEFVNNYAGAIAVNLGYIIDKLVRDPTDYFGGRKYIQEKLRSQGNIFEFMDESVGPALGISSDNIYDGSREVVIDAFRDSFMKPAVDRVEYLLQNTNISIAIYNGNLDAVSNTPGQLEWVDNLEWSGQDDFRNSPRQTLIVNSQIEGYFRETSRLQFYWMNAAGVSVPFDSPVAMRRILDRIVTSN